jgi:hypothetical protein
MGFLGELSMPTVVVLILLLAFVGGGLLGYYEATRLTADQRVIRFLGNLSMPTVVVLALLLALDGGGLLGYYEATRLTAERGVISNDIGAAEEGSTQDVTQVNEADYLAEVGDIQNSSVEIFATSNDKLLRYDVLTPDDVADLQANYSTLAAYNDQIENLDPPEGYREQYQLLSTGVGELYAANLIAYRQASNPLAATYDAFKEYERHVDEATTSLRRSNEILGQQFETTEELQLPTQPI